MTISRFDPNFHLILKVVCPYTMRRKYVHLIYINYGMMFLPLQGNHVGKQELPEYQSRFSDGTVPNTQAGVYGSRANTDNTQNMLRLEQMLSAPNRRKKLDSEMVCY